MASAFVRQLADFGGMLIFVINRFALEQKWHIPKQKVQLN